MTNSPDALAPFGAVRRKGNFLYSVDEGVGYPSSAEADNDKMVTVAVQEGVETGEREFEPFAIRTSSAEKPESF